MNYNELKDKAHSNAVNHGFWKERQSNEHCLMLVITEVAELVEADRKGDKAGYGTKLLVKQDLDAGESFDDVFTSHIKNTVEDEFADIAIRLLDLAGALGIDFEKMQPCRYYRAFDRFSFTENAFALCKGLSKDKIGVEKRIQFGLEYVNNWAKHQGVDLDYFVNIKMKYNETREMMHGKKY